VQRILSSYQPKPVATAPPPNDGGAISQAALAAMIETTKNKQDRNNGSSRLYICCCRAVEHNLSDAATIATVRAYEAVRPFTLARWSDGDIIERLRDAEGTATRGDALDWYERFPLNPLKVVEPQTDAKVETPAVQLPRPVKFGRLLADHPDMAQPIIDGLLRRGETMNVIASPKRGKSWLVYGLALSTCLGRRWLDSFECSPSRVCILDNELHPATLAHRIPIVADAMGLELADYQDRLDIISLRGHLIDLKGVRDVLEKIEANTYDLIVLDAFYRVLPAGVSENDNAAIADLFNQIDKMTARLKCAWVNIHHSSKGAQGQRSVVDVGAGAGAQSRAADTHLVLREHDEDGCVVLDSAVRSFPPIERVVLRWEFPLWERADSLDPTAIKGRGARQENQAKSDKEGTPDVLAALDKNWQTERAIRKAAGMGLDRCVRLLKPMLERGTVQSRPAVRRGKDCTEYRLV
jgi:hypothetical protein